MSFRLAAMSAGINEATFHAWKSRGEQDEAGPFRDFSESIKRAEAEYVRSALELIGSAAKKSWQAAAWLLERRYPHEYGQLKRDPESNESITVNFIRPALNPNAKSDSLEMATPEPLPS